MHIKKNLQNFLLDQDYYIDIYNNCIHVYYYISLITLESKNVTLKLKEFILKITGEDLTVSMMDSHEILIKGLIKNMEFQR